MSQYTGGISTALTDEVGHSFWTLFAVSAYRVISHYAKMLRSALKFQPFLSFKVLFLILTLILCGRLRWFLSASAPLSSAYSRAVNSVSGNRALELHERPTTV